MTRGLPPSLFPTVQTLDRSRGGAVAMGSSTGDAPSPSSMLDSDPAPAHDAVVTASAALRHSLQRVYGGAIAMGNSSKVFSLQESSFTPRSTASRSKMLYQKALGRSLVSSRGIWKNQNNVVHCCHDLN